MTRRKREGERYGIHFTLRGEVADEQAVWDRLAPMLDDGTASAWLRSAVIEKLRQEKANRPATPKSTPVRTNGKPEPHYEEVDE